MRRLGGIITIISIYFFLSLCFSAQIDSIKAFPLKNIKEMSVLVEEMDDEAKEIGLTIDRIQTATELKLRREGIILSNASSSLSPYIYVNITIKGRAFNVQIEVVERVTLRRDPSISCQGTTWSHSVTGTFGAGGADFIISGVERIMDSFLNDYYKANPKK